MLSDLHQSRLSARKCGKIFSEKFRNVSLNFLLDKGRVAEKLPSERFPGFK